MFRLRRRSRRKEILIAIYMLSFSFEQALANGDEVELTALKGEAQRLQHELAALAGSPRGENQTERYGH
jgi:hypothetical protein